jgi:hypothetical protein
MQVQLTDSQAVVLADLIAKHSNGEGVLLTQQSAAVYAAFYAKSFTIYADGETVEEDFG